jgi:hypothetical protein
MRLINQRKKDQKKGSGQEPKLSEREFKGARAEPTDNDKDCQR